MTQNKKRIQPAVGAAVSPAAVSPAAVSPAAVSRGVRAVPVATAPAVRESSFEAVLGRVVRLAHGGTAQALSVAGEKAPVASATPAAQATPQQSLALALEGLDPELALKLRTLAVAGRDGQNITAVQANVARADAAFTTAAGGSSEDRALFADYLRRGHALACATGLDLEKPVAGWSSTGPQSLDERAWLSFGKQLAGSQPDDWQCLAFVEPGAQQISKLYLKLGEHAWWSFQAVLDRPSAAAVDKQKRALASRRSKGVATASLKAVVQRLSGTEGRALRRASRAIRARVGDLVDAK